MWKNWTILLLLAVIVALPFLFRQSERQTLWRPGDPVLVIVTPHNEAIRYEFEHGFSKWHHAKYGTPVKIEWRVIGGTTEIMRFLASEYATAMKARWERHLKKPWPANATDRLAASSMPDDPAVAPVWKMFREIDDPAQFSARIDLFFGGGQFDHEQAHRQGLTVPPWKPGEEPKGLFTQDSGLSTQDSPLLIPEKISGEVWRTPYLFGNVISTFGICYNLDRLAQLGVTRAPTGWDDLADPVYVSQVGAADPTKSGSLAKALEMMIHQKVHDRVIAAGFSDQQIAAFEKSIDAHMKTAGKKYQRGDLPEGVPVEYQHAVERGWLDGIRLVQRIGANARYWTDSSSKVPIDVSVGDAAIGMCIDFYGRFQAQTSQGPDGRQRMAYLTPVGGSSVSCDPVSLLRGAGGSAPENDPERQLLIRKVAVRFIEFTLSEAGQQLWTYRAGEPGGPEKYTLRRLPIRRDFYPSTNPAMQARHEAHAKHAADPLGDVDVDAYRLAEKFIYYPRWTASHFSVQRDLVRVMCMDAGDELRSAWRHIIAHGGPAQQSKAMNTLERMPTVRLWNKTAKRDQDVELTWRNAPDMFKTYDRLEVIRNWTAFFRQSYREAREEVR